MSDPSILYVNADIAAPSRGENGAEPPAVQYTQQLAQPLVSRASDYTLSVIRWQAVRLDIPLFIPSIEIGQMDPSRTTYVFGVAVTPFSGAPTFKRASFVRWQQQVQGQQAAPPPLEQMYLAGRSYYCYDYSHFLLLVNDTLLGLCEAVNADFEAWWTSSGQSGPFPGLSTGRPAFVYSPDADRFSFEVEGPAKAGSEQWHYSMNEPARGLFNHFPCSIKPSDALPYTLRMPARGDADGTLRLHQQRSSTDAWCPIGAICVCTQMPIVSEQNSPPNLLGAGDAAIQAPSYAPVSVITDVALPLARGDDYLGLVSFGETVRRRVQLTSAQPLNTLSFSLYWKHRLSGQLLPCGLDPDGSVSIKAVLERRY